jgi:hypothetical protein
VIYFDIREGIIVDILSIPTTIIPSFHRSSSIGVTGTSVNSSIGVTGTSVNSSIGVTGTSVNSSIGVTGTSVNNSIGVTGTINDGIGLTGTNNDGIGVTGTNNDGTATSNSLVIAITNLADATLVNWEFVLATANCRDRTWQYSQSKNIENGVSHDLSPNNNQIPHDKYLNNSSYNM